MTDALQDLAARYDWLVDRLRDLVRQGEAVSIEDLSLRQTQTPLEERNMWQEMDELFQAGHVRATGRTAAKLLATLDNWPPPEDKVSNEVPRESG